MSRWGTAFILTTCLAVGGACSSAKTVSVDDPGDAGSDGAAGGKYGDSACGVCVAGACASAISTCNADPTCAGYLTCLDACAVTPAGDADPACEAACPAPSGSAGTMARAGLDTCRKQGAGAACGACGASDGGPDGSALCVTTPVLKQTCAPSTATAACAKCELEKCCDSTNKALNGGPATDFSNCWSACNDSACVAACVKKFPSGVQGFGEYVACTEVNCQAPGACATSSKCALCSFQKCGCELANCKVDAGCWQIDDCVGKCTSVACAEACPNGASATSAALFKTFQVCTTQECVSVCGGGG